MLTDDLNYDYKNDPLLSQTTKLLLELNDKVKSLEKRMTEMEERHDPNAFYLDTLSELRSLGVASHVPKDKLTKLDDMISKLSKEYGKGHQFSSYQK